MAVRLKATVPIGALATSGYVYMGQAKPPYTLYFVGAFTGNVQVFSSPDAFIGNVPNPGTPNDIAEFGEVLSATDAETAPLNAMNVTTPTNIAAIRHPVQALIFKSAVGVTGAPATIYIMCEN